MTFNAEASGGPPVFAHYSVLSIYGIANRAKDFALATTVLAAYADRLRPLRAMTSDDPTRRTDRRWDLVADMKEGAASRLPETNVG